METEHTIDPVHYEAVRLEFLAKAAESEGRMRMASHYYIRAAGRYQESSSDDLGLKCMACIEASSRLGYPWS